MCAFFYFPSDSLRFSLQEHAYPADELMPLTCRGRVRGQEPSRGDVDDALGKWVSTQGWRGIARSPSRGRFLEAGDSVFLGIAWISRTALIFH